MVPVGDSPTALEALRAGRNAATVLASPFRWQAEVEGFTQLGTQAAEIAEE